MKKLIFSIMLCLCTLSAHAQLDIKWFNGKTPEQIIAQFGEPNEKDLSGIEYSDYQADFTLFYTHFNVYLNKGTENDRVAYLEAFETDSPDFVVLSEYINGGLRVGDSIDKLSAVVFSATPYGKGKDKNNLRRMKLSCGFGESNESYCIYFEEYNWIGITIENGLIKSWGFYSKEDNPYPGATSLL